MRALKRFVRGILPERLILGLFHRPRAWLVALWYGFPARRIAVIAVAGTKGKTTTAYLIAELLRQAGHPVALMTTAAVRIGDVEQMNTFKMTTPSAWTLQQFFRDAVRAQCTYAVLEVSSHAIMQYRLVGVPVRYAVLTNLAPDHLEYHRTAEEYQAVHRGLITRALEVFVVNADDPHTAIVRGLARHERVYRLTDELATHLHTLELTLPGDFNFSNCLAAATIADELHVPLPTIDRTLTGPIVVPGRFERIPDTNGVTVFVDYAHSPESLEAFFGAVKQVKHQRIITVFGACGERDPLMRPIMGKIIDAASDIVIVTNDDPYGEDPDQIADQLLSGITTKQRDTTLFRILDRRAAIERAASLATAGDVVLVLGKGAEQFQVFADERRPWDDRTVVRDVFVQRALEAKAVA